MNLIMRIGLLAFAGVLHAATPDLLVLRAASSIDAIALPVNQQPDGYGHDLMEQMRQDLGVSLVYTTEPFARALATLATTPNAVYYPLARTPDREHAYQWIGKVGDNRYFFVYLANRSDITLKSLEDAKKYRIGVVRKDVRTEYLLSKGFAEGTENGLRILSTPEATVKMLFSNRVDLIVASERRFQPDCDEYKINCNQLVRSLPLDMPASLWLVAGPKMPPGLRDALRAAHQKQVENGFLGRLMASGRPVN